jgi:hypothetical protein
MKTIDLQTMTDLRRGKIPASTFDIASVLLDQRIRDQPEEFVQEIVEILDEIGDPGVIPVLVQALALWPQYRGLIGPLKGRLQNRVAALRKQKENVLSPAKPGKSIKWVAVGPGHLALGGRPGLKKSRTSRRSVVLTF